jgi:transcriptional regulator with XRE-family HTH domain
MYAYNARTMTTTWQERAEAERSWGTRVAMRRAQLRFSQVQVATIAGVDRSLISRIEANQVVPRFRTMEAVARALGTNVDELFPFESHPQRSAS